MNPFKFVWRRPFFTLFLIAAVVGAGVFGLQKMRADTYPPNETPKIYVYLDQISAKAHHTRKYLADHYDSYFHKGGEASAEHESEHKVLVTSPMIKDVVTTQEYVCQIHSRRQISIQALDNGYLEAIPISEGQTVKKGDLMFQVVPVMYQAKLDAETAEVQLAQLEYNNTKTLYDQKKAVSLNEVLLFKAKLARAIAKKMLAEAELNFASVRAPFDGIVDRQEKQQGSLVKEGEELTTLYDNSVMWAYFNVPEKRYLEYMAETKEEQAATKVELRLASLNMFPEAGKIGAIEAQFDNTTGNLSFRADFPNPNLLLRHGQTGTVVLSRVMKDATVIPQRATYETLAKRYVFVIDKDNTVRQREIAIKTELEDLFVIESGIATTDKIVYEGISQVREGEKVEFEFVSPEEISKNTKFHAE